MAGAQMRRQAGAQLLALLLLAAVALGTAVEAEATQAGDDTYLFEVGAANTDLEDDTAMLTEGVQEFPLVQLPGCLVGNGANYQLPPGVLESCNVELKNLEPGKPQLFMFDINENAEMTVGIVLRVVGGAASMAVWHPGTSANQDPSQTATPWTASEVNSESFINISPDTIISMPGTYVIRVEALRATPLVAWLRVNTPGRDNVLSATEHALMMQLAKSCCQGNVTDSPFCEQIAPTALYRRHSWTHDLCHFGPTSCNAAGELTRLALPDLGLKCPTFPAQLAQLPKLKRLDLSGNDLSAVTVDDVAKVLEKAPALEKLALSSTGLTGELDCTFVEIQTLTTLDLSNNYVEGPLPGCILESLNELYLAGNQLVGTLAGWSSNSQLGALYLNSQREGAGIIGSVPSSFSNMKRLRFVNLAGNSLSGPLPPLPKSLKLLNVSNNHVSGTIGPLPPEIWIYDIHNNRISGSIPPLSMYASLQVFVASNNPLNGGIMALGPNLAQLELVRSGLSGPLPVLPASLRRLDLSDNAFTGDISGWDCANVEMLRLANNQLGGWLPQSLSSSASLVLMDLHGNSLSGPLPAQWKAPRMQMIMLEHNALTGSVPAALATLPSLGVLRLGSNMLSGSLADFASGLREPERVASWASAEQKRRVSNVFDLDLANNQLTGALLPQLAFIGVFNPKLMVVLPGPGGSMTHAPRRLDLSGNQLRGPWPTWVLNKVPEAIAACGCGVSVMLPASEAMNLECPEEELHITDYEWQVAAELGFTCWDGKAQQKVLDFLSSPANSLEEPASDSTSSSGPAAVAAEDVMMRWGIPASRPQAKGLGAGAIAGAVIGSVLGSVLLGLAAYYLVYEHMVKQRKAVAFHRLKDGPITSSAGGCSPGSLGGSHGGSAAAAPLPPLPRPASRDPSRHSRSGGGSTVSPAAPSPSAPGGKRSTPTPTSSSFSSSSSKRDKVGSGSHRQADPRTLDVLEEEARALGLVTEKL